MNDSLKTPNQTKNIPHKGWHSRGYLPHFDQPELVQSITFRLADALPAAIVESLYQEEQNKTITDAEKRQRLENYLDAGYGSCHLQDPRIGELTQNALLHFDSERYHLLAWVIMPNHVHVLIEICDGYPLDKVVQSWKSFTAHQANKILLRDGPFWFSDYFDRFIRDDRHLTNVINYIHQNPVKAGLVETAVDWPFSSAKLWSADGTSARAGGTPALPGKNL
jgi:REP element-mobilizing transposase RayT